MRRSSSLVLLFALVAGLSAQSSKAPQNDSITQADLKADLFFLASDGMRGRLTNTPENTLSAEFIKSRFERLSLTPIGPGSSYFQPYNLITATLGEGNGLSLTIGNGPTIQLVPGQDYYPLRFSASGRAQGQVMFAGFGLEDKTIPHDDFKGSSIAGNIALVLDHEPGETDPASPFDGVVTAQAANPLFKALFAQERGATALLVVSDAHNHPGPVNFQAAATTYWPPQPPRIESYTLATWADRVRIPVAQISPAIADLLVRDSGRTLTDLAKSAEAPGGMTPVLLNKGAQVTLTSAITRHIVPDRNVVAAIQGSDPKLRDEWVIVCAHYDHDGADDTRIFNGADDDGSGTVGLIEIAEAYALAAQAGQRPRRSVLFAAWNSEERGLLGAWAFTESPLFPLDRIVGVLNMDMIGRSEEVPVGGGNRFRGLELQTAESNRNAINIIGTSHSRELAAEVEKANAQFGMELKQRYDNNLSNLMRRSDHWPFLQRGVPALWFHTGLHPDYHTIYDRPEKVDYAKMEKIARLVHQASWNLAQRDGRPRYTGRSKATTSQ